jgi:hypothetical protein
MNLRSISICATLALALTASAVAQNRAFTAIPIGNGNTAGSNVGANTIGSDPIAPCGFIGADVWYVYTATCNGTVTATTCAPGNATYDTVIAAYEGSCGSHNLTYLTCNDDACIGLQSTITFSAAQGVQYYIAVGGYFGATGNFTLNVSCAAAAPLNNECANAIGISLNQRIVGTNVGSTTSAAPSGCNNGLDVWYTFTAAASGPCNVTTCATGGSTNYDTVLNVYTGGCGGLVNVACNDDNCGILESDLTFTAAAGTQYWVTVGGYAPNATTGRFGLKVSQQNNVTFTFWDQGPGTVGFNINDTGGNYYFFVTTDGTNFPNAWFFGINMDWTGITGQATAGYPFQGPLNACGVQGPFGPLPSGFTVYAVAITVPFVGGPAYAVSAPQTFTTL